MNPRERAMTALNHHEPDKFPIDLGATNVTAPTRLAYVSARAYWGLPPDPAPRISDRAMDSVYPMEDFYRKCEVDFRPVTLKPPTNFLPRELPDDSFYDELGVRWKKVLYYYDVVERPLVAATIDTLDKAAWPDPYDPGRVAGLAEETWRQYETTDYALVADIMCMGPFEGACIVRGYEQFCVDLCWNTKFAEALLDKLTDIAIGLWEVFLGAVGEYIQVAAQGDDVGMQQSLFISPALYRKFIKPRQKRIFDFIHSHTRAKVFYHSCGSVYDVIPDFIEIGVDALNPIQRSAAKMDITTLKKEFGRELAFWGGGIDVQQVLPFASLQEIEDEVNRTIDIMAPGGGFVFVPSHNIQPDVSPDRLCKVYETVVKRRSSPVPRGA